MPAYLLFLNTYQVRQTFLNGSELPDPFNITTTRTRALDYDFSDKSVCYVSLTDVIHDWEEGALENHQKWILIKKKF